MDFTTLSRAIAPKPGTQPALDLSDLCRRIHCQSASSSIQASRKPRQSKATTIPQFEWDRQKESIFQLYMREDLPLSELRKRMVELYHFKASEKQYKTQIRRWGMSKNMKEHEMMAIIRIERKRKAAEPSKRSAFCVRGKVVSEAKRIRFIKERNISEHRVIPDAATPAEVVCFTPSNPGSPAMIERPNPEPELQAANPVFEQSLIQTKPEMEPRGVAISPQLSMTRADWFDAFARFKSASMSPSPGWTRFPVLETLQKYLTPKSSYEAQLDYDRSEAEWRLFHAYVDNGTHEFDFDPHDTCCGVCRGWSVLVKLEVLLYHGLKHPAGFQFHPSSLRAEPLFAEAAQIMVDINNNADQSPLEYSTSVELAAMIIAIARLLLIAGERDEAHGIVDTVPAHSKARFGALGPIIIRNMIRLADRFVHDGQYDYADQIFRQVLEPEEYAEAENLARNVNDSLDGGINFSIYHESDKNIQRHVLYKAARMIRLRLEVRFVEVFDDKQDTVDRSQGVQISGGYQTDSERSWIEMNFIQWANL